MTRLLTLDPDRLAPDGAPSTVSAYLSSPQGEKTPPRIAEMLARLDWPSVGAESPPTGEQVHRTRLWLEETALNDARAMLASVRERRAARRAPTTTRFIA